MFSLPGARLGDRTIEHAVVCGARQLYCFDGMLLGFYSRHGFREISRAPWDERFAPQDWDYSRFGRPDLLLMRHNGYRS